MDKQIVDGKGIIITKKQGIIKIAFCWLSKNWKTWIPLLFSIIALWLSYNANNISIKNREDFRAVEKLNLSSEIILEADFNLHKEFVPYIAIKNIGPVKAVQVNAKFFELRHDPVKKIIKFAMSGSSDEIKIPDLESGKDCSFKIPQQYNYDYYRELSRVAKQPIEHFIIEILISYRRESDLKLSSFKAFFFFDENGNIISEKNILEKEKYKEIIECLYKTEIDTNLIVTANRMKGEILHPVSEKEGK